MKLRSLHKCGSTYQYILSERINGMNRKPIIDFSRVHRDVEGWEDDLDGSVLIVRHPINRLISMYYSFGWTHVHDNPTTHQIKQRSRIKSTPMQEWVMQSLRFERQFLNELFNLNIEFIKYEDIMDEPKRYLEFVLNRVDRLHFLDKLYKALDEKGHFTHDGGDKSDEIVNDGLITHRRNLDHNEWKLKFNEDEKIEIDKLMKDTLERYDAINEIPNR